MIAYAQPEYVTCPTGLVLPKDIAEQRYFPRRPIAEPFIEKDKHQSHINERRKDDEQRSR